MLRSAALALGLAAAAPAPAALPAGLARAVAAYDRATVAGDTAALARLVTDDYVLVNSDASVQGKASYLADFRVPGFRIDRYRIEQPLVQVNGAAALTGGLMRLSWTQAGARHARTLRIAHWWVRHAGGWRIAYTQLTRVSD